VITYSNKSGELQDIAIQDEIYAGRFHRKGGYHVSELYPGGHGIEHAREQIRAC
jgi:hypothetical protein